MKQKGVFLKKEFVDRLSDSEYEAIYLLIRVLSSLRLSEKLLIHAIESQKFRNFEILELYSSLLSTYLEATKAYARDISEPIFRVLGMPLYEFTINIRTIFQQPKAQSRMEYQILSFLRDNTTFHFHSEYVGNRRTQENERIRFFGLIDPSKPRSMLLTNTIPHILEKLQDLTGKTFDDDSTALLFREMNENIVYPFIMYIEKLAHNLIDENVEVG